MKPQQIVLLVGNSEDSGHNQSDIFQPTQNALSYLSLSVKTHSCLLFDYITVCSASPHTNQYTEYGSSQVTSMMIKRLIIQLVDSFSPYIKSCHQDTLQNLATN